MLSFGLIAFTAPWVLAALAALPIVWWLLRVTPPAPRLVRFPAIRLLFRLREKEDTPAKTPWWLLLLRLLIVTLAILGLAQPLWNPGGAFRAGGPLVLVIDNGWAAAANWDRRRSLVAELIEKAEREKRQVVLVHTARKSAAAPIEPSRLLRPADAKALFQAMTPEAWPVDRKAAAEALGKISLAAAGNVVWLSDGIDAPETAAFMAALLRLGTVSVQVDGPGAQPLLLHAPRLAGDSSVFRAERPDGERPAAYAVRAFSDDGRGVARQRIDFKAGEKIIEVAFRLPTELRNRISRIDVDRHASAGAVLLLDERLRRRPVGLVAAVARGGSQPLLSDVYYLERALGPYSELRRGNVSELLQRPISVVVLTDSAPASAEEQAQLKRWVNEGGVLIRFAGPLLAESNDELVPVPLRTGDRTFGGAMSWTKPVRLTNFDSRSPFAGLIVPREVTVSRQVLAEPSVDLQKKTWARLEDGTPLVTADRRGKGMIILVHTTANPDWSNLALSGLFVEMLRRMVELSHGVAAGGEDRPQNLAPHQTLDGFGRLGAPPPSALAVDSTKLDKVVIGPQHPPGFYGDAASRRGINLSVSVTSVRPLGELPSGMEKSVYRDSTEVDLKPLLLAAALGLLLFDLFLSFFLRGLFIRRIPTPSAAATAKASLMLVAAAAAFALVAMAPSPGMAQTEAEPSSDPAIRATKSTVLAYILTGDSETDRVSRAALIGLGRILTERTSVEPAPPQGVNPNNDELAFYPVIYWPVTAAQAAPSRAGVNRLLAYLRNGGMIIFDIRNQGSTLEDSGHLRRLVQGLNIPALQRMPEDHVLTRAYYLLPRFPGRFAGNPVWVARADQAAKDGVSPVIIGSNDWGAAWAVDDRGRGMFPVTPGGEVQREYAYRAGVNMVMYALSGNYKADQVHIPTILKRLGQ
ncbi:MAG: DUF4159 domain-containing protein [Rhodospirillaceae bacterium]|nr:DUF4159 domain-containing protein [Rhodospirillaceae bacterium]